MSISPGLGIAPGFGCVMMTSGLIIPGDGNLYSQSGRMKFSESMPVLDSSGYMTRDDSGNMAGRKIYSRPEMEMKNDETWVWRAQASSFVVFCGRRRFAEGC